MVKNLYLGQYKHKKSFIHTLDPRFKLLYVIFLSILIFFIDSSNKILIFSLFIALTILLSKLETKNLIIGLKPFYFIFIFIFLMYVLFSRSKLEQGLIAIWRVLMLILMSLVLTYTTTISNLVAAIEKLLKPFKVLNVKPRNVAVMISIAIRFIPVMVVNLERLKDAMLARLADFRKLRNIKLLMLALLERMFKSASNLSDALQSRLYNENVESQKVLKLKLYDYLSLAIVIFLVIVIY